MMNDYDWIDYLLLLTFIFMCMILGFTIILFVGLLL